MTQSFTDLERGHADFYVPAYRIVVNEQDLLTDLHMEISSVQVDNTLKGADRFSFTVNGGYNFQTREFRARERALISDVFAFGNSVKIYMGYKSPTPPPLMLWGKVTSLQTSFPAAGFPQITVSGYDLSYCMTVGRGKEPLNWPNKTDSEVVFDVALSYGLRPVVEDTQVRHPMTVKGQESDMQFLERLADRNGYELYTVEDVIYFRPPAHAGDPVISLEWGAGLVSFSPEFNISEQVSKVEVRGWDVNTKQEIVGTAERGDERGQEPGRQSGAELLTSVCRDKTELKVREPVFSRQEADRRAEAILKRRSEMFVQGSGESIGLPEIRPDRNIELKGLGKPFNKQRYYVEQSTHTINNSGYKTTFKVKEPNR